MGGWVDGWMGQLVDERIGRMCMSQDNLTGEKWEISFLIAATA